MFPEIRKQSTEMVESFKYAGVVDGRSVEQDTEKDENKSGDSKGAVDKRPNELPILFRFYRLDHVGETKESSGC